MNKSNASRWVSVLGASALALSAAGCATTSGRLAANGPGTTRDARACDAGVALVSPASQTRGVASVDGREASVLDVDGNEVRFVPAANGYAMRARGAVNSDVGRGNVGHCAF